MNRWSQLVVLVGAVLLALLAVPGCGGGGKSTGGRTVVVFWQFFPAEQVQPVLDEFMKQNPDIEVRMGKIYENMMVDLMATSKKLVERGRRTLMTVTGLDYDAACVRLDEAAGNVKVAVVMTLANVPADEARARIERAGGFVRGALEEGAKP